MTGVLRAVHNFCRNKPAAALALALYVVGCAHQPRLVPVDQRQAIDRKNIDYPGGFALEPFISNLSTPSAIAWDDQGAILIAEGGRDEEPRIFGYRTNGTYFQVYPYGRPLPFDNPLGRLLPYPGWQMYGPVGGMAFYQGRVYVSHRDENGMGVVTALDYQGHHTTIIAGLPAQGDYGVTDLAIGNNGRLYFGVGTATNSGVVGLDNWSGGWVRQYPHAHDVPYLKLQLRGFRFSSPNPRAGLFGPNDTAVTAPDQQFNSSDRTTVEPSMAEQGKPSGSIMSVDPRGGDPQVEAHGIHNPRGLCFNEFGRLYFTNDGMEMRGTRPVKDDPCALLRLVPGVPFYGWPDYTADCQPVSDPKFQPPTDLIIKSGYPQVLFLIDLEASGLTPPNRDTLVQATFPSLCGAAKMDFVPATGAFREFRGNAIICQSGDRYPFATSGRKLVGPIGYKIVRVDVDSHQVKDFIRNTAGVPRHMIRGADPNLLERPIDAKFGPDGSLYIVDYGRMTMKDGNEDTDDGTGQILRLVPIKIPARTDVKVIR